MNYNIDVNVIFLVGYRIIVDIQDVSFVVLVVKMAKRNDVYKR